MQYHLKAKSSLDIKGLLDGFKKATGCLHGSAFKPVEGTMLTVIRVKLLKSFENADNSTTFEVFLNLLKNLSLCLW